MKKGSKAILTVKKALLTDWGYDGGEYECRVIRMNEAEEMLYLILGAGELTELSLDCIYNCVVKTVDSEVTCTGRIRERYIGSEGKIIKLQIENGFYKISIK